MERRLDAFLARSLAKTDAAGLRRRLEAWDSPAGPVRRLNGGELLSFNSNDYLGLANHPDVCRALVAGVGRWGVGAGAAHLLGGRSAEHAALEEELAALVGRDRALLFGSGYLANVGVVNALASRGDSVFEDRLNHASLIDGALGCRASLRRYRHGDAGHLSEMLGADSSRHRLVATDGVFSMDGDVAPLEALSAVCCRHDAWLMVDDAHGLGVLGNSGAGSLDAAGLSQDEVPVLMATLGKALGVCGAFVAGSNVLIDYLVQRARTFVYSTAPPSALAAATRAALRLLRDEPQRRVHLQQLVARFREGAMAAGVQLMPSHTPIQPLVLGNVARLRHWQDALRRRGIVTAAVRPPTVPQGTARLRITLTAAHTLEMVDRLLEALTSIAAVEPTELRQVVA